MEKWVNFHVMWVCVTMTRYAFGLQMGRTACRYRW